MRTVTIPADTFESLSVGFVRGTADFMHSHLVRPDSTLAHPGDGFGRVLAWTWQTQGAAQAALLVARLLAALQDRQREREAPKPVTVDELVHGVQYALPGSMSSTEIQEVLTSIRRRVPGLFNAAR